MCTGTLKGLEKDLENLVHKCDRFTEEMGTEMDVMTLDGYEVALSDQCTALRLMIYRRQTYLFTKEKADVAEEKRAQQKGDNLLRNSPLIKLTGKTNLLPWFGGVHHLIDKLPKSCDDILLTDAIKDSMVNPLDMHCLKSIYTMSGLMKHVYTKYILI